MDCAEIEGFSLSDRPPHYSQSVANSKFWIGVLLILAFVGVMLVLSMSENGGCLPWQERVGVKGDTFSGMKGITRCR